MTANPEIFNAVSVAPALPYPVMDDGVVQDCPFADKMEERNVKRKTNVWIEHMEFILLFGIDLLEQTNWCCKS